MATLPLDKRVLYSTTFCTYREFSESKIICNHPYSFKICDLDLCPIAMNHFANIVFLPEGVTLVVKEPDENKIAGKWRKVRIDISANLDNEEEVIAVVRKEASKINEKNMKALIERIHRIFSRYQFLKEKGKELPILQEMLAEEETEVEEERETIEGELDESESP